MGAERVDREPEIAKPAAAGLTDAWSQDRRAVTPATQLGPVAAAGNAAIARLIERKNGAGLPRPVRGGPARRGAPGAVSPILARQPPATLPPPNATVDPGQSKNVGPAPAGDDFKTRKSTPPAGAFNGRKIGTWGRFIDTDLTAGQRDERNSQTSDEATAYARGVARASAIIKEKVAHESSPEDAIDAWVVYPIVEHTWFSSRAPGARSYLAAAASRRSSPKAGSRSTQW